MFLRSRLLQKSKKRRFDNAPPPGGVRGLIAALCLTCAFAVALTACGASDSASAEEENIPTITVGCDTYPPFSYVDVDGNLTGIDIELATEAFGRMGYDPQFTIINWEEKKSLLEKGDIDCIWSSFTIDGREDEYKWAGPYMQSHQVVAVNIDSDIYSLQDLEDKTIAVQSTTKPEDIMRAHDGRLPQLRKIISVQKRDLIFILLSKGYVDALAAHDTSVDEFMAECGLKFRILDEPLQTVGLGAAFRVSDESGISEKLSVIIDDMNKDGTTEKVIGKYLSEPERYIISEGAGDENGK